MAAEARRGEWKPSSRTGSPMGADNQLHQTAAISQAGRQAATVLRRLPTSGAAS